MITLLCLHDNMYSYTTDHRILHLHILHQQIIPPIRWKPIDVASNHVLEKCVTQNITTQGDIFAIEFGNESKKTLGHYRSLATKANFNGNIESKFWEGLTTSVGRSPIPIYAIDNEFSLFPDNWTMWNLNKLSAKESILHGNHLLWLIKRWCSQI